MVSSKAWQMVCPHCPDRRSRSSPLPSKPLGRPGVSVHQALTGSTPVVLEARSSEKWKCRFGKRVMSRVSQERHWRMHLPLNHRTSAWWNQFVRQYSSISKNYVISEFLAPLFNLKTWSGRSGVMLPNCPQPVTSVLAQGDAAPRPLPFTTCVSASWVLRVL